MIPSKDVHQPGTGSRRIGSGDEVYRAVVTPLANTTSSATEWCQRQCRYLREGLASGSLVALRLDREVAAMLTSS
jgi:hypothetical protein